MTLAFTSCCCVDFDITKNDEFGSLECCNNGTKFVGCNICGVINQFFRRRTTELIINFCLGF